MFQKIFCVFLFIFSLIFFPKKIWASNLVQNPGFENEIEGWKTNNSTVLFSATGEEFFEGTQSARISNPKTSSYGVEQILTDISSSLTYQIKANLKLISPYPEKAFLRVAWYKSVDGSGSQSSTDDSNYATPSSDWQEISLTKNPTEGINSAKIRLLVASGSAYFDNVSFIEYFYPSSTPEPTPPLPSGFEGQAETPSPTPEPTSTPTPTTILISYDNIFLSEIMVNPDTNQKECVEIYNNNDFSVNLTNWYVDDLENSGSSPKSFSLTLPAKSYGVIELSSSIFNNDADIVRLLDFNKQEKDSFEYAESEKTKTWGRINLDSDDFCLQEPSSGTVNNSCILNPVANQTSVSNPIPTAIKNIVNKPIPKKANLTNQNISSGQNYDYAGSEQVLGTETTKKQSDNFSPTVNSLSLSSFLYSLLTIASVFLKIKKWV